MNKFKIREIDKKKFVWPKKRILEHNLEKLIYPTKNIFRACLRCFKDVFSKSQIHFAVLNTVSINLQIFLKVTVAEFKV